MKKRLILGDIHGHYDYVQEIYNIENPDQVICLGDYMDSFNIQPEDIYRSFVNLLSLRLTHIKSHGKGTFQLLMGNHDFHYILNDYSERYSGWNAQTRKLCIDSLKNCLDSEILKMCYIDEINKTIYSHAGVSQTWFNDWCQGSLGNIHTVTFDAFRFTFGNRMDSTGDNKWSSPIWIRPYSLGTDMYKDNDGVVWRQVVGHTQSKCIIDFITKDKFLKDFEHPNFIMCDCLPWEYLVEYIDDNGKIVSWESKKYKTFDENYRQ